MTLVYDFFGFLAWNSLQWLFFIILTAAFFFLIIGSSDLKKNNFDSTKYLFFAGLLLLIWQIVRLLRPVVSGVSPTNTERLLGFLYSLFLMGGIIYSSLHILLGISFVLLGRKNRDPGGIVIIFGGILYIIAWILNLIIVILSKYAGWFDPTFLVSIAGMVEIFVWILYIANIIAALGILTYSFLTKRVLFIIFGVLFFIAYLIQLLDFLGII
jgi:hypothetical protein